MLLTLLAMPTRRLALCSLLAASCSLLDRSLLLPATAAGQRGEELNPQIMFDARPCIKRTPLGACAEQGGVTTVAPAPGASGGMRIVDATASRTAEAGPAESDYIQKLRERSEANAEVNAAFVREKTLANGMGAAFGPFSSNTAVMRADGTIMIIPIGKFDRLKDRGFIVASPTTGAHQPTKTETILCGGRVDDAGHLGSSLSELEKLRPMLFQDGVLFNLNTL